MRRLQCGRWISCTVGQRELMTSSKLSIRRFTLRGKPGKVRILADCEVEPALGRPLLGSVREPDLAVDFAVHAVRVRRRNVVLDDDFGLSGLRRLMRRMKRIVSRYRARDRPDCRQRRRIPG